MIIHRKQGSFLKRFGEACSLSHLFYFSHNSNVLNYLVNCLEHLFFKERGSGKKAWCSQVNLQSGVRGQDKQTLQQPKAVHITDFLGDFKP